MKPRLFLILLVLRAGLMPAWANEPARPVHEYTMKAVYLYNFAQLTTWPSRPENSDNSFNLCVLGESELDSSLNELRGRLVRQLPLRVLRISNAVEARQCHMLYLGENQAERAGRLLETLRGSPILTVTDTESLGRSSPMLQIVTEGRRLSFDVNIDSVQLSQLKFSSKLLSLARRVHGR